MVKYGILTCFSLSPCCKPTRAEQEVTLQKLRDEWESQQVMEKESLERKQQLVLEKMKLEMEEAQQKEMTELEQEKEQFLSELKERLDREKKKVRSLLPARVRPTLCMLTWLALQCSSVEVK